MTQQTDTERIAAAIERLTAVVGGAVDLLEQLTEAYVGAHSKAEPVLEDGLPMGDEEPPLPMAPPYITVSGQYPPITGPVVNAPPQPQAQVVSPTPPMPAGLCPEHRVPWSKFVEAGVSKRTGRAYGAFWACPATDCKQKPPR